MGLSRPDPSVEERSSTGSYSDLVVAGLMAQASSAPPISSASGAVQSAAGLWAQCLGACRSNVPGVDAALLSNIGYDLGIEGESLWAIVAGPSGLELERASTWSVNGASTNPRGWTYDATFSGPSAFTTRLLPAAAVLHFRYLPSNRQPWRGVAPWQRSPTLASLAAEIETALRDEARQPVQAIIPAPTGIKEETADALTVKLTDRRRPLSIVEGMMQSFGAGRMNAPQGDWSVKRLKPDPAATLVSLCKDVPGAVGVLYGVPIVMTTGSGSETIVREAFRRFVTTTISPLAVLIGDVLTEALEQPVELDLTPLRSRDVAGIARAVHVLTQSGMSLDDALEQAGATE